MTMSKVTDNQYHVHCLICNKAYDNNIQSEECFKNHNEIDSLRWITKEALNLKYYLYDLNSRIDEIVKRFNIESEE